MATNIQDMTPVEIDTLLAPIWERQADVQAQILRYKKIETQIFSTIEKIKRGEKVLRVVTAFDGIELMEKLALIGRYLVNEGNKLAALELEALPYEAEYTRRGGWNRVFLATSSNGHAHNGQNCSTCHHGEYRTNFAWLIQYSGKSQDEIVADAGERACTTCYPSAPVNAKGTKMFTPDEVEAQTAREAREAERARKAAEADAKSITTPEGTPLYEDKRNDWKVKTLRTAEICATDALADLIVAQRNATDPEFTWRYGSDPVVAEHEQMEIARHACCLIRSIAAKKRLTFQEVFETHEKKAQAKVRKQDREWAKDPRNPNRSK